jgi:hypothetical protein
MIFIVESYDDDQQQGFTDYVNASNADGAHVMVSDHRPYAVVTRVASQEEEVARLEEVRGLTHDKVEEAWWAMLAASPGVAEEAG